MLIRTILCCVKVRQVVIAVTLTPVRDKRHMQFLTSTPNFMGLADPLTWPSQAPERNCVLITLKSLL